MAQQTDTSAADAKRSMVTREELQAALDQIDKGLQSSAYSQSLRSAKQAEAAAIRERLAGGDLRPGDEIKVDVLAEPGLTSIYTVTASRTIVLPGGTEIPLKGVLRSEVQQYLTTQLKKFIIDPNVTATASVRLSMFGGINHPGFYNIPANMLLSLAIQNPSYGGGPANNAKWESSQILRDGKVVVDGPEFQQAVFKGRTLDQLNVQAGDEIRVGLKPSSALFWRIVAGVSAISGIVYLAVILFRL